MPKFILNGSIRAVLEQKEIEAADEQEAKEKYLKMLIENQVMVVDHSTDGMEITVEKTEEGVQ